MKLYDDQEVGDLEDILLPGECRFCGIDDKPYVENEGYTFMCESSWGTTYWSAGPFCVCCDACGARGPSRSSPEAAIQAWNRAGKPGPKRRKPGGKGDGYMKKTSGKNRKGRKDRPLPRQSKEEVMA